MCERSSQRVLPRTLTSTHTRRRARTPVQRASPAQGVMQSTDPSQHNGGSHRSTRTRLAKVPLLRGTTLLRTARWSIHNSTSSGHPKLRWSTSPSACTASNRMMARCSHWLVLLGCLLAVLSVMLWNTPKAMNLSFWCSGACADGSASARESMLRPSRRVVCMVGRSPAHYGQHAAFLTALFVLSRGRAPRRWGGTYCDDVHGRQQAGTAAAPASAPRVMSADDNTFVIRSSEYG